MTTPKVSVVMSVYNSEKYLREAVDSILNQTFRDFEFIIIDDGSTDGTAAILESYTDPRIVRLKNETNIRLTKSLNRGLAVAQGEYIARMDADDVSLPERLEKQVAFLDEHAEVGLIGAGYLEYNEQTGRQRFIRNPADDWELRWYMLFDNHVAHPSCMFRRALVQEIGLYDEHIPYAQDYDFFSRIASISYVGNLPGPLTTFRVRSDQISIRKGEEQRECALRISTRNINRVMGGTLGIPEVDLMRRLWTIGEWLPPNDIAKATILIERLLAAYCSSYPSSTSTAKETSANLSHLKRLVFGRIRANAVYYELAWVDTGVSLPARLDISRPMPDDLLLKSYLAMVQNTLDDTAEHVLGEYIENLIFNWEDLKWRALTACQKAARTAWRAGRDQEMLTWLARAIRLYSWVPW